MASVAVAVLTMAACGDSAPSKLDVPQVEDMIAKELADADIDAEVKCPEEVELKKDDTFTCEITPDKGDEFEIEVTQRDANGKVAFQRFVLLERDDVERAVAKGVTSQIDEEMSADCSEDLEEDEQIFEDGEKLSCELVGENGTTAKVQVSVDRDNEDGFTFELVGAPVATTSTTTTTTTTTLPPTTLPPTTLPPDDTIDTTGTDETIDTAVLDPEQVFFDGFFDNSSGWLVASETPGLSVEVTGQTYTWFVQPDPATDPLPFEAVPDAMQERTDLTDVDVSVQLSFIDGMGGVSCMSSAQGSYVFAVGSNRAYIAKIDDVRNLTELVSEPFTIDASETFIEVRAECFPTADGVQLNLEVDDELVAAFEDTTDPHTTGSAGLFLDFDREVPLEERLEAVVVFDDFEVLEF